MRHQHSEVIKAWADGAEIEVMSSCHGWMAVHGHPLWDVSQEYRVKPAHNIYKKDAETWGNALNEAAWAFIDNCPEKSSLLFNTCKTALREAISVYLQTVDEGETK